MAVRTHKKEHMATIRKVRKSPHIDTAVLITTKGPITHVSAKGVGVTMALVNWMKINENNANTILNAVDIYKAQTKDQPKQKPVGILPDPKSIQIKETDNEQPS